MCMCDNINIINIIIINESNNDNINVILLLCVMKY